MPEMVKKIYQCPVCKSRHNIEFPVDFAKNRSKFPFTYVCLHKFEGKAADVSDSQIDILTTLYLDANLDIRGVEAMKQEADNDIISKDDSTKMMETLTNHIIDLQTEYAKLEAKYNDLLAKQ
jgi:transcription elongation factor Elf1